MWFVCLQGYIMMNDSWYLISDGYKKDILRRKGGLEMFVRTHPRDVTWITRLPSSHNVPLAWLFPMRWRSKRWFCFVQIEQAHQLCHKKRSLPSSGPYPAKSNISPNNKVNTRYNGQCSEEKTFTTSGGQIWQMEEEIHMTTSSSK